MGMTADDVAAMFRTPPAARRRPGHHTTNRRHVEAVTLIEWQCNQCSGPVYTVLPEDPETIQRHARLCARCADF